MFLKPDQQLQNINIHCSKCDKPYQECKCPDVKKRMHKFAGSTLEDTVAGMIGESLRG
jgi:hypothetical protein